MSSLRNQKEHQETWLGEVDSKVSCSLWTTSSDLTTAGSALLSPRHFQVSLISINPFRSSQFPFFPSFLLGRAPIGWRSIGHILLRGKWLKSLVDTSRFYSSTPFHNCDFPRKQTVSYLCPVSIFPFQNTWPRISCHSYQSGTRASFPYPPEEINQPANREWWNIVAVSRKFQWDQFPLALRHNRHMLRS